MIHDCGHCNYLGEDDYNIDNFGEEILFGICYNESSLYCNKKVKYIDKCGRYFPNVVMLMAEIEKKDSIK